jgi:hypothetical protein
LSFGSRAVVAELTLAGVVPTHFLVHEQVNAAPHKEGPGLLRPGPVG